MTAPAAASAILRRLSGEGEDWATLLSMILRSFAYMNGRIDPPSSALRLTPEALAQKARDEFCLVIEEGAGPLACAFLDFRPDCLYVGKLAVEPRCQGAGHGSRLLREAERIATGLGRQWLELQTRVELSENHRYFTGQGFVKTSEGSHPGYDRPTWIVMRKPVAKVGQTGT